MHFCVRGTARTQVSFTALIMLVICFFIGYRRRNVNAFDGELQIKAAVVTVERLIRRSNDEGNERLIWYRTGEAGSRESGSEIIEVSFGNENKRCLFCLFRVLYDIFFVEVAVN